jgi:hypothetical protein
VSPDREPAPTIPSERRSRADRIHVVTVTVLQVLLVIELAVVLIGRQWFNAVLIVAIVAVTAAPFIFRERLPVVIPAEFQLLAGLFVFGSLYLGEVRGFYERIWWWDLALHLGSGLLLGVLGFLLVYVLNENDRIDLHMQPRFVALFAFVFAVSLGALWEIFEFTMDQLFGTNMQEPMLGDDSGLTDTMWDLIVDSVGAAAISLYGWFFLSRGSRSFVEEWIAKFVATNPRLFGSRG